MLPENIDFSNEQHSAVSIGISYFKFKIIPGKLFGDGEENFSFSELGLIISGYVCIVNVLPTFQYYCSREETSYKQNHFYCFLHWRLSLGSSIVGLQDLNRNQCSD